MDRGKVCLRLAVATPDLEWICIVVPFALWDLRIEGGDVQLLALRGRVTSETCRIQTCSIRRVFNINSGQLHTRARGCRLTEAFGKSRTISSFNSLAQSFNRWQYLLGQVIIIICCAGRLSDSIQRPTDQRGNTQRDKYITYLAIIISLPDFVRMPSSVSLTSLGRFPTGSQAEDVRHNISRTGSSSLGFHPQCDLHVGLTLSIRIILRILSQALEKESEINRNLAHVSVGSVNHMHTLKITKSSDFICPPLIFSPTPRRYSWIFSTTISVISPDRI